MRRIRTSAAALLTGLALTVPVAATAEAAAAAPTVAPTTATSSSCHPQSFRHYNTIRKGSKGIQATSMECLLHEVGRSTSVNGKFSAHDASELAKYRSSKGLKAGKVADRRVWSSLLSRGTRPELKRGDSGAAVLRLQRSLQSVGWTKVDLNSAYDAKTVSVVKSAQKQRHLKRTGKVTPALWKALQAGKVAGPGTSSSKGAKALAFAKKQLGDSYRFGGSGPNVWDCSGLTRGAWKKAGVNLPHSAAAQFHRGKHISKSHLKKGDLVFFYSGPSHVGIYAGHGKVIHAPRPGSKVSYIKMSYMPFKGARRP